MIPHYEKVPTGKIVLGDQPLPGCKEVLTIIASRLHGKQWKAFGSAENYTRSGTHDGWNAQFYLSRSALVEARYTSKSSLRD